MRLKRLDPDSLVVTDRPWTPFAAALIAALVVSPPLYLLTSVGPFALAPPLLCLVGALREVRTEIDKRGDLVTHTVGWPVGKRRQVKRLAHFSGLELRDGPVGRFSRPYILFGEEAWPLAAEAALHALRKKAIARVQAFLEE